MSEEQHQTYLVLSRVSHVVKRSLDCGCLRVVVDDYAERLAPGGRVVDAVGLVPVEVASSPLYDTGDLRLPRG